MPGVPPPPPHLRPRPYCLLNNKTQLAGQFIGQFVKNGYELLFLYVHIVIQNIIDPFATSLRK